MILLKAPGVFGYRAAKALTMSQERIRELFYRYFNGLSSPEENRELAELLQGNDREDQIRQLLQEAWNNFRPGHPLFSQVESERLLENVLSATENTDYEEDIPQIRPLFGWKSLAASVAVLLTAGWLFLRENDSETVGLPITSSLDIDQDFSPGSNKAYLTLSDGRDIVLDHADPGLLTTDGHMRIIKEEGDRLSYEPVSEQISGKPAFNTLRTPRGGQYHVVLPDGTKVWLNAASSITYPVHFTGNMREVKIEGEVYFEVAKRSRENEKIPFIVSAGEMSVEVLGTHFNINAYKDEEQIKTTLIEGSVKVRTPFASSLLKPGHEARIESASADIRVARANTEQALAWKNGYFQFQEASLEEIMRQLSKWYDVDVRFEGKPLERKFSGEIPRSATLVQVLEILEISQVRMTLSDKVITIRSSF